MLLSGHRPETQKSLYRYEAHVKIPFGSFPRGRSHRKLFYDCNRLTMRIAKQLAVTRSEVQMANSVSYLLLHK